MKEQSEVTKLSDPTMVIYPKENDMLLWYAFLFGPEDSPFKDGIFKVNKIQYLQSSGLVYPQPTL